MSTESLQEFREFIKPPELPARLYEDYLTFLALVKPPKPEKKIKDNEEKIVFDEIKREAITETLTRILRWTKRLCDESVEPALSSQSAQTGGVSEESYKPLSPAQKIAFVQGFLSEGIPSTETFKLEQMLITLANQLIIEKLRAESGEEAATALALSIALHA